MTESSSGVDRSEDQATLGTQIRRADLEADHDLIVDCLARWLMPASDARRFAWLYRDNPVGEARVWLSSDDSDGTTVGLGAAFPRRLRHAGQDVAAWVLADFCINPAYRTLGPALQLQRACMSVVEADGSAFGYDFPSQGMMAVYKRLRHAPVGELVRLARPLRVDRKVHEKVNVPGVSQALSAAGNLVLGLRDAFQGGHKGLVVAAHAGPCGPEFSTLARQVEDDFGLCVHRSAEYLNWRYLGATHAQYEVFAARRDGALVGYAVVAAAGEDASLVDLFGVDDPSVLGPLVNVVSNNLRKRGVMTLSAPLWARHRWLPLLKHLGFVPRESTPVVAFGALGANGPPLGELDWFLWQGDRDS